MSHVGASFRLLIMQFLSVAVQQIDWVGRWVIMLF